MKASKIPDLSGSFNESAPKSSKEEHLFCATLKSGKLRSVPIIKIFSLTERYFPFPQPTSRTNDPLGKESRNYFIFGHGLYLV